MTNIDCVGQYDLCKNNHTPTGVQFKTGDYKESNYIEVDSESHDRCNHGLFCVTGNDSELIDIEDLY